MMNFGGLLRVYQTSLCIRLYKEVSSALFHWDINCFAFKVNIVKFVISSLNESD